MLSFIVYVLFAIQAGEKGYHLGLGAFAPHPQGYHLGLGAFAPKKEK